MPIEETLTLQLAPDTVRYIAEHRMTLEGTRHREHLTAACRRAERGQRRNINAPLWDLHISAAAVENLIVNPDQHSSSSFHHELVKACRAVADREAGINDNPPCHLCNRPYASQFFMNGFWAHDGCLDAAYENAA